MLKIAIVDKMHEDGIKLLKDNSKFNCEIIEDLSKENLLSKLPNFDGITLRRGKIDAEILEKCKKLKVISRHGVGYDNVDIDFLKKNNISLLVTGTTTSTSPAEHIMFMILNISKGMNLYDDSVRNGKFDTIMHMKHKTFELSNKKILIVGFGRIGKKLIKRCLGFEMKVYVYDPFVSKEAIEKLGGIKVDSMNESCKDMDAISLHIPLNEKTKNIINYDLLKTMRKNCIIINAARGGIVNEFDLNKALDENLIFGAGLDVFEIEPPESNNPLLKNDKVFLSPHTAAFTEECMTRMGKETIQNIIDFFDEKLEKSKIVKL